MSAGISIAQQCPLASKYVGATSYRDLLRHFPYTYRNYANKTQDPT